MQCQLWDFLRKYWNDTYTRSAVFVFGFLSVSWYALLLLLWNEECVCVFPLVEYVAVIYTHCVIGLACRAGLVGGLNWSYLFLSMLNVKFW